MAFVGSNLMGYFSRRKTWVKENLWKYWRASSWSWEKRSPLPTSCTRTITSPDRVNTGNPLTWTPQARHSYKLTFWNNQLRRVRVWGHDTTRNILVVTWEMGMVVTMPKERDDFSGRYILRPRVFCSSGMGQVSTMSSL